MPTFNMFDAKSNLSRLGEAVESGREREIIIARDGKPVARLVPIEAARDTSKPHRPRDGAVCGPHLSRIQCTTTKPPRFSTARKSEVLAGYAYCDRLLVAQALTEPMVLITSDVMVARYSETIVRV